MVTAVLVVLFAAAAVLVDRYFRTPKPFGLYAFEIHGLNRASGDVLKAVVATISFLGHPFTVVVEARTAKASAMTTSADALLQVGDNLEAIRGLEALNLALKSEAEVADNRASKLDTLIAQVSSVVGDK